MTIRRRIVQTRTARSGFTLLELLLALSLSVVILMAIGMAIHLHMRSLDSRRTYLEESQLARSVLRIMADDIRSVALRYEQDVSSVEELMKGAVQSAAGQLLAGGATAGGLASGVSTISGGGSTGGAASATSGGALPESGQESGSGETDPSQSEEDLSTVALPATPGIFGTQTQIQIDISRLPRIEEYQQTIQSDPLATVQDIPSDVKTVTYYVQSDTASGMALAGPQIATLAQLTDPDVTPGLVRQEQDRAVMSWATTNGTAAMMTQSGDVLAPEVVSVEFQYFDGIEWRLEWDTETEQALPVAIQISLAMQSMEQTEPLAANPVSATAAQPLIDETGLRYYTLVVQLPVGMPTEASPEQDLEGTGI